MISIRHKGFWISIIAFAFFSVFAGILVLRPHRKMADACCQGKHSKSAMEGKECPMHGAKADGAGFQLPAGHPDIQQVTKAGPLTDEQLASGAKAGCPYLARQGKDAQKS